MGARSSQSLQDGESPTFALLIERRHDDPRFGPPLDTLGTFTRLPGRVVSARGTCVCEWQEVSGGARIALTDVRERAIVEGGYGRYVP